MRCEDGMYFPPEEIQACLNCTKPVCNNCFAVDSQKHRDEVARSRKKSKERISKMADDQKKRRSMFNIDREIESVLAGLVDPDTGEIDMELYTDAKKRLDALDIERTDKIEAVGKDYLKAKSMMETAKAEMTRIGLIADYWRRRAEQDKNILDSTLNGERFESATVRVSYRKSPPHVVYADGFIENEMRLGRDDFINYKDPEVNRIKLKRALMDGEKIPFASLESDVSIVIK